MAKHPFAAKALKDLEENGVTFGASTPSVEEAERPKPTVPEESAVEEQPAVEQASSESEKQSEAPEVEADSQDEKDRLLALQREEIERLKSSLAQPKDEALAKSERESQLEQELADLRARLSAQEEAQQADEFRNMLERQGFDSANLDDDVMIELRDTFFKPAAAKISALEKQIAALGDKLRDPTPQEKLEQIKQVTQQNVIKAVPDFMTVYNSKAFKDKLGERDNRFPFDTYGEALQAAYERGNHDFIIQEVKAFLGGGKPPSVKDIADVGATNGVASKPATQQPAGDGFTFTDEEAVQMLRKRQMGRLTKAEYSAYRAKLDASRSRTS